VHGRFWFYRLALLASSPTNFIHAFGKFNMAFHPKVSALKLRITWLVTFAEGAQNTFKYRPK
jgi:hypothetical protein